VAEVSKLNEITILDAFNEAGDEDDDDWKCLTVIGHMWQKYDANDGHVKVHVL
jgi:hypothetical protein